MQLDAVQSPRQRLRHEGQRSEPRGPGNHEASRRAVTIQLRLDRIEQHGNVLVLVDEHRPRPRHEQSRVLSGGIAHRQIVEVHDAGVMALRERSQQRRLADCAWPLHQQHRYLADSLERDVLGTTLYQCCHTRPARGPATLPLNCRYSYRENTHISAVIW